MLQLAECLLFKYKFLSLSPRTYLKKLGVTASTCNPNTKELETGGSLGFSEQLA